MISVCETEEYVQRLLSSRRKGEQEVLAFYEHRHGVICKNPKLMLMPMDDHLAHRGDGIFESIKWQNGYIYLLDEHLERMKRSCKALHLSPPCTWERLREIIIEVTRSTDEQHGLLRILIGRGPGGFGLDPAECPIASLYVVGYRFTPKTTEWYGKGVTAFHSSIPAKPAYLAKMKNANYIPNVLMVREAREKGYDIPFCFDDDDFLAEGATENIVLVDQEDRLIVPEMTQALTGTTLMRVIDLVKDEIEIIFRPVREIDIFRAKEVMVLGTTRDCTSIVRFEGQPIHNVKPGPVSHRFRALLTNDLATHGIPAFE